MTVADDALWALRTSPAGMTDAELAKRLALALSDKPRYRTFLGEADWALKRLDITVYLVTAGGSVEIWEREN
jgi:hypothetical protein